MENFRQHNSSGRKLQQANMTLIEYRFCLPRAGGRFSDIIRATVNLKQRRVRIPVKRY